MSTETGHMARHSSIEDYLARHHILTYIEDATTQLLKFKSDLQSRVDVNQFFAQYFTCLKEGRHAILRDFEFINSTPYNRACFIETFLRSFGALGKKGDLLSIRDYYALVSMICSDFPYELLQKTAQIVLIDDAHDCLISFTDFIYSFQLQLYYQEFLEVSHSVYQSSMGENHSPRDIVVPTDHTTEEVKRERSQSSNNPSSEGVDSTKFFRSLRQLPEKHKFSMPSVAILKDILSTNPTITFYDFLTTLSKSEAINAAIGKLPPRANIFDDVTCVWSEVALEQPMQNPPVEKAKQMETTLSEIPPAVTEPVVTVEEEPTPVIVKPKKPPSAVKSGTRRELGLLRNHKRSVSSDSSSDDSSSTDTG